MPRKPPPKTDRHNRWADHYTRQARKDNYAARSVYKLQEIQKRYRPLHSGDRILDLGCAPGSWLQYAARVVGPRGSVLGLDLKAVRLKLPQHVHCRVADIFELDDRVRALLGPGFQVVLSDMAPATTGRKDVDAARSLHLCERALDLARDHLTGGGRFVCKVFQGPDSPAFIETVEQHFARCHIYKPQSSRKASREIYVVGKGKKQEA